MDHLARGREEIGHQADRLLRDGHGFVALALERAEQVAIGVVDLVDARAVRSPHGQAHARDPEDRPRRGHTLQTHLHNQIAIVTRDTIRGVP